MSSKGPLQYMVYVLFLIILAPEESCWSILLPSNHFMVCSKPGSQRKYTLKSVTKAKMRNVTPEWNLLMLAYVHNILSRKINFSLRDGFHIVPVDRVRALCHLTRYDRHPSSRNDFMLEKPIFGRELGIEIFNKPSVCSSKSLWNDRKSDEKHEMWHGDIVVSTL